MDENSEDKIPDRIRQDWAVRHRREPTLTVCVVFYAHYSRPNDSILGREKLSFCPGLVYDGEIAFRRGLTFVRPLPENKGKTLSSIFECSNCAIGKQ